jgi:hypothetical protein
LLEIVPDTLVAARADPTIEKSSKKTASAAACGSWALIERTR